MRNVIIAGEPETATVGASGPQENLSRLSQKVQRELTQEKGFKQEMLLLLMN